MHYSFAGGQTSAGRFNLGRRLEWLGGTVMKFRRTVRAVVTACLLTLCLGSARAVTFDVSGSNIFGATLTGAIFGDAALTSINSVNLQVSGVADPLIFFGGGNASSFQASNISGFAATIYLSSPPGLAELQAQHDANAITWLITFNPASCGSDLACQSIVTAQRAGALQFNDDLFFRQFVATAAVLETPLPTALPLFATGLGVLGWRRKRKAV